MSVSIGYWIMVLIMGMFCGYYVLLRRVCFFVLFRKYELGLGLRGYLGWKFGKGVCCCVWFV